MWGYDLVSDAVIAWIGPALIVLVGALDPADAALAARSALFSLAMVVVYIAVTVTLLELLRAPGQPRARWRSIRASAGRWPTRSRPTRRSRASAPRRARRRGSASSPRDWRKAATLITWNRYTDVWLVQNLLLVGAAGGPDRPPGPAGCSQQGRRRRRRLRDHHLHAHERLPAQHGRQHPHAAAGPGRRRGRGPLRAAWRRSVADAPDARAVPRPRSARSCFDDVTFRYKSRRRAALRATSPCASARASGWRWWGRRGRASRPS